VRLITRNGHDFAGRFPLIIAAVAALPARSCVVDGEAIACEKNGLSVFEMIRWRQHDNGVTLCAFDLLELDGEDLRREPIEVRKATLKGLLRRARPGIAFNRHFRSRRRDRLRTSLRARLRGHRVETTRVAVSIGP
jgi:bifunctional non-homologous end joining protein LigD